MQSSAGKLIDHFLQQTDKFLYKKICCGNNKCCNVHIFIIVTDKAITCYTHSYVIGNL